jgi:hypothetical protein
MDDMFQINLSKFCLAQFCLDFDQVLKWRKITVLNIVGHLLHGRLKKIVKFFIEIKIISNLT